MTEERGLRVISITRNIPHHKVTIEAELNRLDFSLTSDEAVYILTECDFIQMKLDYDKLFKKYIDQREELLRYKCTMKELKLLMEADE